jgi:hypothetical protein
LSAVLHTVSSKIIQKSDGSSYMNK